MAELEGKTLDRYELLRLIGKGGMANVYEAYDPSMHRTVAIKVFKREDEEMLRRFIREAQLMASLRHPHLVQVYDTGESKIDGFSRYYIVMPLLTGGSLRVRIRRFPLSLSEICQCLNDIGGALDYIHSQGIIHRDIKASNVLLNDEGRCYLTDFGIARITSDATQLTSTGDVLGTVDYVAPELFEVHRRADARSDLYSLGVVLYEMVTGHLPFSAENQLALISMHVSKRPPSPRQSVPELPVAVERVIYKALEKKPESRYESATALAEAFCRAAASKSGRNMAGAASQSGHQPSDLTPGFGKNGQQVSLQNPFEDRPSPPTILHDERPFRLTPPVVSGNVPDMSPTVIQSPITRRRVPRRRTIFLAILGLIALLILIVPITYALRGSSSSIPTSPIVQASATATTGQASTPKSVSPTPNATQTAQAAVNATGTAYAQATASASAAETATVQSQASATVGPIQTATSAQPVYQDPLTNPENASTTAANWDQSTRCIFTTSGYHVKQPASGTFFKGCREYNQTYGDLALSVNATILSGHSGGVFFRLSTNFIGSYIGYLFEFDSQGNYKISREDGLDAVTLQDWRPNTALHSGYKVGNLIQLIARGSMFSFYANGHFVYQMQNSDYPDANTIGFLATSTSGGDDADVAYNNLSVYALP